MTSDLPGRLGERDLLLVDDPRLDPRIRAVIQSAEGFSTPTLPEQTASTYEQALAQFTALEADLDAAAEEMRPLLPEWPTVRTSIELIDGVDGNQVKLFIRRPTSSTGPLPCVYHMHGGGMVMQSTDDPVYSRLQHALASSGLIVIGVEFRNGAGKLGNHPFPAGLNDCTSGLQWTERNRENLGIGKIVIAGESGGANLCLATVLKAKREGWLSAISGVFAMCPFISGDFLNPPGGGQSVTENEEYLISSVMMQAIPKIYDPSGNHARNPLAWPLHASHSDLAGLPPHVIHVNELDPLRDEGTTYYRKLLAAGTPTVGRIALGMPHGGEALFADAVPDVFKDLISTIASFARSV